MGHRIAIVGYGNIARAVIGGILKTDKSCHFSVFTPHPPAELSEDRCRFTILNNAQEALTEHFDFIIFCVKPWIMKDVYLPLDWPASPIIASCVAGMTYAEYLRAAKHNIVTIMPNLACEIGTGCVAVVADNEPAKENKTAGREQACENLKALLSGCGTAMILKEDQLDAFILIAGSGPAIMYQVVQCYIDEGTKYGLTQKQAVDLTLASLQGSLALYASKKDTDTPLQLKKKICTPNGCTIAGCDKFDQQNGPEIVKKALTAIVERLETIRKNAL